METSVSNLEHSKQTFTKIFKYNFALLFYEWQKLIAKNSNA